LHGKLQEVSWAPNENLVVTFGGNEIHTKNSQGIFGCDFLLE